MRLEWSAAHLFRLDDYAVICENAVLCLLDVLHIDAATTIVNQDGTVAGRQRVQSGGACGKEKTKL